MTDARRAISTVLFDLDGTLTDSARGIMNSVAYALQRMGIEETDPERLRRFVGPPLKDSFHDWYGVPEPELDRAVGLYREYYLPRGLYESSVYGGVPEMLECLRSRGMRLFVATAKPQPMAERVVEHFGLARYFEAVTGARMDETRTAKHEIIRHLIDVNLGGIACGLAMVGDTVYDMRGAAALGIPAVGAAWGYGKRDELISAGASAIAANPGDLPRILERGL